VELKAGLLLSNMQRLRAVSFSVCVWATFSGAWGGSIPDEMCDIDDPTPEACSMKGGKWGPNRQGFVQTKFGLKPQTGQVTDIVEDPEIEETAAEVYAAFPGASVPAKDVAIVLAPLIDDFPGQRLAVWKSLDKDHSGDVSNSEFQSWAQRTLIQKHGRDKGRKLFSHFRSSVITAFNGAREQLSDGRPHLRLVQLRLACHLLCVHTLMYDAFLSAMGSPEQVGSQITSIGRSKWLSFTGHNFAGSGFVGLNHVSSDVANSLTAADVDGNGEVSLPEWYKFLIKKEQEARTPFSTLLSSAM